MLSILFVVEKGGTPRVADFVHGSNGLGNVILPSPSSKKVEKSAAEFLVDTVSQYPGEVSILALGPLTNLAQVSFYVLFHSSLRLLPCVFQGYISCIFTIRQSKWTLPLRAR